MKLPAAFGVLLLGLARAPVPEGEVDLRSLIETAAEDGITDEELRTLSARALESAAQATSRSRFWNAIGLVADLCEAGPILETRAVRARALRALASRESDTLRWSSLVTSAFLPPFASIPREHWSRELTSYDQQLEALIAESDSSRVRSELKYARLYARAYINRRWDWLSESDRTDVLAMIDALEAESGDRPVPGSGDPKQETLAKRARALEYEFRHLYFGAPAPPTSGIDLKGDPFDLADTRGQVVVLDFWTTFCQPCLALVPAVLDLMDELSDEPVTYLGVNGDTDRVAGLATARRHGMNWRNLWDGPRGPDGPAARAWNVPALGWPSVFVLDKRGRIRFKLRGKDQVEAELEKAIRTLLAE